MRADHDHDTGLPLVPLADALERVKALVRPLPPADLALVDAHGSVAAADVLAPIDLPPFTSSAMDGYAVRAEDVAGASADGPVALRPVGEVRMGSPPEIEVGVGETVAVPTGGVVPPGTDAVVPVERTIRESNRVLVLAPVAAGRYVRRAGEDVRAGEVLIPAEKRLLAADLGLLASAGLASMRAIPRARVGILSTGDELVAPGAPLEPGRIPDANAVTLHGCVLEAGAVPVPLGRVPDDGPALVRALTEAEDVDVLVSSGGVSVGERDPVKVAFGTGSQVELVEVAMQPGKPQAFGTVGGRPYFGLPGNPVSAFVSFEVFVRPALLAMMGRRAGRTEVQATLDADVTGPEEKVQFARVRLSRAGDGWVASPTGPGGSNLLATLSRADGLAVIPVGVATAAAGTSVRVIIVREGA